ncbi:MAG TPA: hypothetical protein VN112_22660 [Ensifer sp.]|nr:hypothetical protein [Ensifer sp.]
MSSRLLWAAVAVILIAAAIIYFKTSATTDQPANERPTPHAINQ